MLTLNVKYSGRLEPQGVDRENIGVQGSLRPGEINTAMPHHVIERVIAALNERGRALKGSRVLVLGAAYKPDVDDCRESPAIELMERSLDVYRKAADYAKSRGLILADTKFEWGRLPDGAIILVDEVLTPDSSRYWPADSYQMGRNPPSFDKQFVRDWLETTSWDKSSPPPALPEDVVARTREKYLEAYQRLTGKPLAEE